MNNAKELSYQQKLASRNHFYIFLSAAIGSLLLSVIAFLNMGVINPDGICYLQSAKTFSVSFYDAMHLCDQAKWPFYSACIYWVSHLLHIPIPLSAYCLDSCFTLVSILAFIGIIHFICSDNRILLFALLTILTAHEFNLLRPEIVRDHGFWAFYLLSFVFLLHFFKNFRTGNALAWNGTLIMAALFRVEAIIFLLLVPFAVFLDRRQNWTLAFKNFLQLCFLTMVGCCGLIIWLTFHPHQEVSRLSEIYLEITHGWNMVHQTIVAQADFLSQSVFLTASSQEKYFLLSILLLSWYLIKVIANLTLLFSAVILYAWHTKALRTESFIKLVIWTYIAINLIITIVFFSQHFFLAKRYLIALSIILMLYVPFGLEQLYQHNKKWFLSVLLFMMLGFSVSSVQHILHSKTYLKEAGVWLSNNTDRQDKIFSNDYQLLYYTNRFDNDIFKQPLEISYLKNHLQEYDYLAIRKLKSDPHGIAVAHMTPIKQFANDRGDQVIIYRIQHLKA